MAIEQPGFCIGLYVAGASLATRQFEVVKISTAGKIIAVSSAGSYLGVLQNNPTSGDEARVMVNGISKVKAGGAAGRSQRAQIALSTAAGGALSAITSATPALGNNVGIFLEASAQAGDIVTALINFGNV